MAKDASILYVFLQLEARLVFDIGQLLALLFELHWLLDLVDNVFEIPAHASLQDIGLQQNITDDTTGCAVSLVGIVIHYKLFDDAVYLSGSFFVVAPHNKQFFADLQQKGLLFTAEFHPSRYSKLPKRNAGYLLLSYHHTIGCCADQAFLPAGEHAILPDESLAVAKAVGRLMTHYAPCDANE